MTQRSKHQNHQGTPLSVCFFGDLMNLKGCIRCGDLWQQHMQTTPAEGSHLQSDEGGQELRFWPD